jgi:WXG100 family type VII secretion target
MQFKLTPEELTAGATSCTTTAAQIDQQLSTLQGYVQNLEATYMGVTATTFSALMVDWNTYATMLHNALIDIGSGLNGNYHNYTDTEQANLNGLQQINGSLPGIGRMPTLIDQGQPLPTANL